jgi:hypothetical protein
MGDWSRPLTEAEQACIAEARSGASLRYEGRVVPHRSCGIALAETFGRPTAAYQALRRGGITGNGECGTAVAGRLLLGELLGDPNPAGAATPLLQAAVREYEARWRERVGVGHDTTCNTLVSAFSDFRGESRARFCTNLAADTAALVAETLLRNGVAVEVVPVA